MTENSGFKEFNINDDKAIEAGSGGFETEREDENWNLNQDLKKEIKEQPKPKPKDEWLTKLENLDRSKIESKID